MLRRVLAAVLAAGAVLGLAACAPAVPGVPGSGDWSIGWSDSPASPPQAPAPSEPESAVQGAIVIGEGDIQIDIWVDFFCPYCSAFEETNGEYIAGLVEDGEATLRVHPIAILDRASMGTAYSTRSANAFVCVGELAPGDALVYFQRLYEIQPEEGTPGLDDEALVAEAPRAASECIEGGWFRDWVGEWTERSIDAGIRGTPTVMVDTELFQDDYDEFEEFVTSVS